MKTLYLTKSGGTTDLSAYSTTAQADALYAPITRTRRNLLINGCMRVWQRGTSQTGVTTSTYGPDRFKWVVSSDATVSISRVDSTDTGIEFAKHLQIDVTTADASIAAGQYGGMVYFMEGLDAHTLRLGYANAKTVTLSFYHAHTKTGTHTGSIRNDGNNRSYTFEYTQSVADAWEQAEITIPLDTTGTWLTTVGVGLKIHLAAAVGSNLQTAAGSWTAGNYLGTANQVNNLDSVSNFMRFGNVQLEIGDEKTDFEPRGYGEEVALCQRYYVKIADSIASAFGSMQASTTGNVLLPLPVPMRATPTLTTVAADHRLRTAAVNLTPSAISVVENTFSGVTLSVTVTGGTQYEACALRSNSVPIEFSAELG